MSNRESDAPSERAVSRQAQSNEARSDEALSDEARSDEARSDEALSHQAPRLEALSREELELLARVRRQRREERAPVDLRQRARARALAEAARPEATHAVPAAALVPIARPSLRFGLRLLAVAAGVIGVIVGAPVLLPSVSQRLAQAPEPPSTGNWQASGPAGELLGHQSPLLSLPLLPLAEDQPLVVGPSLLRELPFAEPGVSERGLSEKGLSAWQVRRWNDPKANPEEPAAYDFREGALCVSLAPGERVLGGWPWPSAGAAAPDKVPLSEGRAYRLGFRAWVRGARPRMLLLGVGHIQFPFVAAAAARVQVSPEPERFGMDFVASHADDAVGVAFLAINYPRAEPLRVCLADVTLSER